MSDHVYWILAATVKDGQRDEFDAAKEMAANARAENDSLKKQIEALEVRIAALEGKK